ncbi:glycosyltransferase family 4 protein [bacterium]|nr:glycosyltransferase family 4 protein [candidate division CSSED10-310 bacterium]
MKIAFADQSFHWPPTGGSWIDVREIARNLISAGMETRIFTPVCTRWNIPGGQILSDPGVPVETFDVTRENYNAKFLPVLFREKIHHWNPDAVIISNTFYLAPSLISALCDFPIFLRIFAYELICPNYASLYRGDVFKWSAHQSQICPNNLLTNTIQCWWCALSHMAGTLIGSRLNPVADEYWKSNAFLPQYSSYMKTTLPKLKSLIVSTPFIRDRFASSDIRIDVIPGGVDAEQFAAQPIKRQNNQPVNILMAGRSDDRRKGFEIFEDAIISLKKQYPFINAYVTDPRSEFNSPVINSKGWIDRKDIPKLYQSMDIIVCPSLWPEPFGLVPLEAMACGIPVVVSDTGGMHYTVDHMKTGIRIEPGSSLQLVKALRTLIENPSLRDSMGKAGRQRVLTHFNWSQIVKTFYIPLLTEIATEPLDWTRMLGRP